MIRHKMLLLSEVETISFHVLMQYHPVVERTVTEL